MFSKIVMVNTKKKPVCLHFHIFKNAGSTVDYILKKNFSTDAILLDTGKPQGILSFETVLHCFNKHYPNVKSLSSHQLRFPIPQNSGFNFLPMVFIRHPIDRAFSIFSFDKRRKDNKGATGVEMAKNLPASEYFKWSITQDERYIMKNFQVIFLSSKPPLVKAETQDLKIAIERLKECKVVGVVERMDESLLYAEENLRQWFSEIDFSYVEQNVSEEREVKLNDRLEKLRAKIGDKTYSEFEDTNKLDFKLYLKANKILDEKLKSVENFDEKMLDFKKRCKNLQ